MPPASSVIGGRRPIKRDRARRIWWPCFGAALVFAATGAQAMNAGSDNKGQVTIRRDAYGVPHIFADDRYSLFYGFGYALAEDRLFQMEMTKRSATGRVAEVLGKSYLALDKATRANYDPASLRRQFAALDPASRSVLEGYARGYNARVDEVLRNRALLPREYETFGFSPTHIDVDQIMAIFVYGLAIRFSGFNGEVDNLKFLTSLRRMHNEKDAIDIFRTLLWEEDVHTPTTIAADEGSKTFPPTFEVNERLRSALATWGKAQSLAPISTDALARIQDQRALVFGENNRAQAPHASLGWTSGKRRTDGANAVYVDGAQMGFQTPSIVWSVGLHGAGFNVVGESQVGVPAVLFGTNGKIVWGGTAGMGDVVDMYQEKLNPNDTRSYMFNSTYRPMERRTERFTVKDGPVETEEVFSTVHGLVKTFDPINGVAYAEKRAWQGHELESLFGWLESTRAETYEQWRDRVATWGLSINLVYADHLGNVAYVYAGKYPKRPSNQDFRLPAIGTGEMEWEGILPFTNNPQIFEPKSGTVASWNNLSQRGYHSSDSIYWSRLDHVAEIQKLLDRKPRLTEDDVWDVIKGVSFVDGNARVMKPLLEGGLSAADDTRSKQAVAILAAWDGVSSDPNSDGPAQLIFSRWLQIAQHRLLERDLPKEYLDKTAPITRGYSSMFAVSREFPTNGTAALAHALDEGARGGPGYDFLHGENRDAFIQRTFAEALTQLSAEYGADMVQWRRPAAKHVFSTKNFSGVPVTTPDQSFNYSRAMNRATFNFKVTFSEKGASMCDVVAPGQSAFRPIGGASTSHEKDQVDLYGNFQCKPRWIRPDDVVSHAVSTKRLRF